MNKKKIYLNLTNGLEAIERYGFNRGDVSFVHIRSSHCESHDFETILWDIDNDLLMHLALGYECIIYDFGARSDIPKAVYTGLTWLDYVLTKRWFNKDKDIYVKGKIVNSYYNEKYKMLSKKVRKKIDYYRYFLLTDEIRLTAVCGSTSRDNDKEYYKSIIEKSESKEI